MRSESMIGMTFGRWTVLGEPRRSKVKWKGMVVPVRCQCGTKKLLREYNLRNGLTRSCGCHVKETHDKIMGTWFSGAEERRATFTSRYR